MNENITYCLHDKHRVNIFFQKSWSAQKEDKNLHLQRKSYVIIYMMLYGTFQLQDTEWLNLLPKTWRPVKEASQAILTLCDVVYLSTAEHHGVIFK